MASTLAAVLIFTIVVDVLGNLLVILSVYRNKKLRNAGERRGAGREEEEELGYAIRRGREAAGRQDQALQRPPPLEGGVGVLVELRLLLLLLSEIAQAEFIRAPKGARRSRNVGAGLEARRGFRASRASKAQAELSVPSGVQVPSPPPPPCFTENPPRRSRFLPCA